MSESLNERTRQLVFHGYAVAALWSSTDETEEGKPLDEEYDISDLDVDTSINMHRECDEFCDQNLTLVLEYVERRGVECRAHGYSAWECVGHDLWLTRNGHGVGFWDRGLGELGDKLTEAARAAGERTLYAGSDGQLYCTP